MKMMMKLPTTKAHLNMALALTFPAVLVAAAPSAEHDTIYRCNVNENDVKHLVPSRLFALGLMRFCCHHRCQHVERNGIPLPNETWNPRPPLSPRHSLNKEPLSKIQLSSPPPSSLLPSQNPTRSLSGTSHPLHPTTNSPT